LAWPATAVFASAVAPAGHGPGQPPHPLEDQFVDVLEDVEDAQLVACVGPQLGQHAGVEVGAVADHNPESQSPIPASAAAGAAAGLAYLSPTFLAAPGAAVALGGAADLLHFRHDHGLCSWGSGVTFRLPGTQVLSFNPF